MIHERFRHALIIQQTGISATPLLVAGFGELLGQRAGLINVSIEGTMLMGAPSLDMPPFCSPAFGRRRNPGGDRRGHHHGGSVCHGVGLVSRRSDRRGHGTQYPGRRRLHRAAFRLLQMALRDRPAGELANIHFFSPLSFHFLDGIPVMGPALGEILSQYPLFYIAILLAILLFVVMSHSRLGIIIPIPWAILRMPATPPAFAYDGRAPFCCS